MTWTLYKAAEGNYPKNHGEFMEKIIKDADIKLPATCPPEAVTIYDPD